LYIITAAGLLGFGEGWLIGMILIGFGVSQKFGYVAWLRNGMLFSTLGNFFYDSNHGNMNEFLLFCTRFSRNFHHVQTDNCRFITVVFYDTGILPCSCCG
jgi:hypothetical protein